MKIIKINESQKNRLFEAYKDGFSFETLTMIADAAFDSEDNSVPQMNYCTKWLGYPDSMGSSRMVYTLSDNYVLKLAYGNMYMAGIEQNRVECKIFENINSPLLVKILYHDKNFTYLVSESVLPAKAEDFEKMLGLPFYRTYRQHTEKEPLSRRRPELGDAEIGFDDYFENLRGFEERLDISLPSVSAIISYLENEYSLGNGGFCWELEKIISNNPWLKELKELIIRTQMTDLGQIANFGIVNRDGNPMLVVLDSGFNHEVWDKFYR